MASVSRWVVGIFAAWGLVAAPSEAAPSERGASAGPVFVDAFDVEQVPALVPGAALQFSVFASPGASTTVMVEGVRRLVELREVSPGVYEGTHVIEPGDRIREQSTAIATVWRDGIVVRATLEEALVLDGAPPPRVAAPPVYAGPPAATPFPGPTPPAVVPPPATTPSRPVPQVDEPWRDPRRTSVPYHARNTLPPLPPAPAAVPPASPEGRLVACRDCAVVESIRVVEKPSGPAAAGAVAGTIVGAILGDQIGKAHEKHVTRVLGAVGGAVVGHEIGRSASRIGYDVALRLPHGALKVVRYDTAPPYRVGQLVRLEDVAAAGSVPSL